MIKYYCKVEKCCQKDFYRNKVNGSKIRKEKNYLPFCNNSIKEILKNDRSL